MKAQFGSLRSFMICACSHCTDDHFTIPDSLVAACLMFCQRFFPRFPDDFADCFSDSADEFGTICLTLSTISTTISSTILPTIFGLRLTRSLTKKSKKVAKIIACLSTKDCNHNCVVGKLGGRVVWEIFVGVRVWLGRGVLLGSEMGHQGLRSGVLGVTGGPLYSKPQGVENWIGQDRTSQQCCHGARVARPKTAQARSSHVLP